MAWTGSAAQIAVVNLVEYRIDAVTAGGDTESVNQQSIYEIMELVSRDILRSVDLDRVLFAGSDGTSTADAAKVDAGLSANNYLIVPAPSDFLRLLRIQTSEWKRPVDVASQVMANRYVRRFNPGSAPDTSRPMAAVVTRPLAGATHAVECYPLITFSTVTVSAFYYAAEVAPESMPTEFKDAMIADSAARVLFTTGDMERGLAQKQISEQLLRPMRTGQVGEEFALIEQR